MGVQPFIRSYTLGRTGQYLLEKVTVLENQKSTNPFFWIYLDSFFSIVIEIWNWNLNFLNIASWNFVLNRNR